MSAARASRVPADVPAWPVWMAPVAVAGAWAAGWVVAILVVVTLAVRGADRFDGASVLLLVTLTAAAGTAVVALLAARVASPRPADFGVRAVPLRLAAAAVGLGAAVVIAAALAAQALGGAFDGLAVPAEVSGQGALWRALGDPDATVVELDAGAAASILARALVMPLFLELLLRGFCLPVLARRLGDLRGAAIVAAATALFVAAAAGSAWFLLPGLALGAVLCLLYLETGSVLPGAVVSAAWSGALLGVAFRWSAVDAAFLALSCGVLAAGAGLAFARSRGADLRAAYP